MKTPEQQMIPTPASLLTVDEAAQRLNVDPTTIREMLANQQVQTVDVDGEPRLEVRQLDALTSRSLKDALVGGSGETPRPLLD